MKMVPCRSWYREPGYIRSIANCRQSMMSDLIINIINSSLNLRINLLRGLYKSLQQAGEINKEFAHFVTSSTLVAVFADVSKKMRPFSLANCSPSSLEIWRRCSRSLLFPISMIVIFRLPFCLASSSHRVKWANVSRLWRTWSEKMQYFYKIPSDIINKQGACSTSIIWSGNWSEWFLSSLTMVNISGQVNIIPTKQTEHDKHAFLCNIAIYQNRHK
jgi:hypothetical protein